MFFCDICVKRAVFGSFGHFHKWGYDEITLISLLKRKGYRNVERKNFLESEIPNIKNVEERNDLIVEGKK